jgi:23S rRNA (uracil-5-)-methyltransferase RumA
MTILCPKKDVCGSCGWSHIPYDKQLTQKLSDINGSFALKKLDLRCKEILPSPITSHYRNRMDFVIDFEGRVGLRQKGKWWRVIDDHPCFISDENIEHIFYSVRKWTKNADLTFFDRKAHHGFLRYAVIRTTTTGESMLNLVTSAPVDDTEKHKFLDTTKSLLTDLEVTALIWSINHTISDVSFGDELTTLYGPGYIEEEINGFKYRITPNAFFQTNPRGAALLLDTVKEFAGDLTNKTLLDLYCGSGFFSIALASSAKRTIGVELNADAIRDARMHADLNDVAVEYHDAKTEDFDWMSFEANTVILDPPRSGMHDKALQHVLKAKPREIIYISCNYKHLARELVMLTEIYDVVVMRAIDMFPHTPHVETVVKLALKA